MRKKIKLNSELALLFAIILIAFAIVFIIKADLGMTVVQAPVQILSIAVPQVSMGSWNYIVQGIIAILMIILAGRFKISYILSFAAAVLYGFILDFVLAIMANIMPTLIWERILFYIAGHLLLCFSIAIFFTCKAPLMPYDIFIREVAAARNINIVKFKWIYDISSLVLAVVLSLSLTGKIMALGVGTIIFAFTVSPVVSVFMKPVNAFFEFKPLLKDKEFILRKKNSP